MPAQFATTVWRSVTFGGQLSRMAEGLVRTTSEPDEHDAAAQHIAERSSRVATSHLRRLKAPSPHCVDGSQSRRHAILSLQAEGHSTCQIKRNHGSDDERYSFGTHNSAPIAVVQDRHLPRPLTR